MKYNLSKGKKILIAILSFLFILFFFLSTMVKYWVVKNSEELVGRKLEISELHFNYAQIALRIKGFNLFEADKTRSFVAFNELYVNYSPWNLLVGEYACSEIYLDGLDVKIIRDSLGFNFDSMIPVQDSIVEEPTEKKDLKFSIKNINFKNGNFRYTDVLKKNTIEFEKMDLELPLIAWNNEKSEMGVEFAMGNKGKVRVNADVDHAKNLYAVDLAMQAIDLDPIKAYLADYINISSISGQLNTSIQLKGNMDKPMDLIVSGQTNLVNFEMKDADKKKLFAAKTVDVDLDSLNIGTSYFEIGAIHIDSPEIYASLDSASTNFERLLSPMMQADSLAVDTITTQIDTVSNLFYQVKSITVTNGLMNFKDNTLNRPFVYDLKAIDIKMGTLSEKADSIPLSYSMNLHGSGRSSGEGIFSLKDLMSVSFKTHVENLEMMSFSPYTEFYIARPITQGEFNYKTSIEMTNSKLKNENNIRISELDFGDKTEDQNTIKAPVRLALYLLKDKNDLIAFDLPVSGNPSSPDFRLGKIIWKTLMNFLIKTASQPFNILGNLAGGNPESIKTIPFHFLQDSLDAVQMKNLTRIATILSKKKELSFSFIQQTNLQKEKELLAIKNSVKNYCNANDMTYPVVSDDQIPAWALANLDFINYLKSIGNFDNAESLEASCIKLIGENELNQQFTSLLNARNIALQAYMRDSLQLEPTSFKVKTADLRNMPEQLKSPNYRVEVSLK
ncbi:DUF748 domain-containing protein [Ancylomarina euxinus]|uniref:DUF748 domain-containing protein n=1 Tax=Ancylomarina euxinus TaxID=2283627 RepID=A0A425Y7W2_9BACT|nr:DUF748 domain-containing protein [Ancylomarina euxinus]MCZ4693612.1 DUF748 domain-containing protein [Ancylomarina euxinus]MUP13840.1 DUF748 domain-containing protein [Ancylomarina euxinus]RRG24528.1 DUF748 domain-containing protein [Ancylomarina euxinus]